MARDLVREDMELQLRLSVLRGQPLDMAKEYGARGAIVAAEVGTNREDAEAEADLGVVSVGPDAEFDNAPGMTSGPWGDGPTRRKVRREPRRGAE